MKQQQGFSIIVLTFWLMLLASGGLYAAAVWPIYNTYWKIQDAFEGIAKNLNTSSETEIMRRLPDLLHTQYLNANKMPDDFYKHLKITSNGEGYLKISSSYHVTAWFLGKPDNEPEQKGTTVQGKWRSIQLQMKQEFDMKPYAESTHEAD